MADPKNSEIDQLWTRYSKEDLWKRVSEWWESASRARVVMLLAMNHQQELSLDEIVTGAGTSEANVLNVLAEFENEGVIERRGQPPRYAVTDEAAFLRHMQLCCQRTAVAANTLGTLAGWAGGSE